MLHITDGVRSFWLTYEEQLTLAISLNRSNYGEQLAHVCESLHDINRWKTLEITIYVSPYHYDLLVIVCQ